MVVDKYSGDGFHFSYSVTESPRDSEYKLHIHDDYEILCVESGTVGYIVEGTVYELLPGSLVLMRSAEVHKLIVYGDEIYKRYTINFKPETLLRYGFSPTLLDAFVQRGIGERNLYVPENFSGISPLGIFSQMRAGISKIKEDTVVVANLSALLCAINTIFYDRAEAHESHMDDYEKNVLSFVNEHILEDITLSEISKEMHMSSSQLNRTFNKITGTSVYNYIIKKRLIYAQGMISRGQNAISASQACGFKDYSSFFRLYKKHFGHSPTDDKSKLRTV